MKPPALPKILIALVGGLAMGLAPAPINAWFLAWLGLIPVWVFVVRSSERWAAGTGKPADRLLPIALAWGIGYHGLALFWITGLHPLTWLGVPWLGSVAIVTFCWVFITLWGAALVGVWAWGMGLLERLWKLGRTKTVSSLPTDTSASLPAWLRVLWGTALWCSLESLWELGPLYWTSISYTQSPGNRLILHLGQLSGPMTVTAAIVAVNGLLAEAWVSWGKRSGGAVESNRGVFSRSAAPKMLVSSAAILLLTLHGIGFALYSRPLVDSPQSALKVGILQGNIPTRLKLSSEGIRRAIAHYTEGYETLADQGVDAVLTPEGAMPFLWEGQNRTRNPIYQAILEKGVVAWLGTFVTEGKHFTQSLLTITETGATMSRYNKVKLVPLGEYIPFEGVLGALINRLSPLEASMVPGRTDQVFNTPFGRAAVGICYESAYARLFRSQVAKGGEFLITASNLDPYSTVLMAQDQAQGLMRAIETDRWAVRATNTGYSSIVDPHGKVVWRSQSNVYEIHAATIQLRQTQTPYVRWGNWLTPLLLGLSLVSWRVHWRR